MLQTRVVQVSLLLKLLLTSVAGINFTHFEEFVLSIQGLYNFESFVVISDKDFPQKLEAQKFIKFVQTIVSVPTVNVYESAEYELREVLTHNIFAVIFISNMNEFALLKVADITLRGRHNAKVIIVSKEKPFRVENLKPMFVLCRKLNFLNVAVFFESVHGTLEKFTYNPFPETAVVNVTSLENQDIFWNKTKNVFGYTFTSPVGRDAPRIILIKELTENNDEEIKKITGIGAEILLHFIEKINGTFHRLLNWTFNADMNRMKELVMNKEIEICIHPYGIFNLNRTSVSYPLRSVDWCLMVPMIHGIPRYMYLVLPFNKSVWFTLVGLMFYSSILEHLVMVVIKDSKGFGYIWCKILTQILYIPGYRISLCWRDISINAQILFLGFIVSNLYLAFLTSFLTSTVHGPQIDSVQDVIHYNIKIKVISYEAQELIEIVSSNFPHEFFDILEETDIDEFVSLRTELNTSYAYPATTERWEYALSQQKHTKKPLFRVSEVCFGKFALVYGMQLDSPFVEPLNDFLLLVKQTGLYSRWEDTTFQEALQSGLVRRIVSQSENCHALSLTHLTLIWYTLAFGLGLSCVAFMLELVLFYGKKNFKHFSQL